MRRTIRLSTKSPNPGVIARIAMPIRTNVPRNPVHTSPLGRRSHCTVFSATYSADCVIHPGEFCLGRTEEWVELADDLVARARTLALELHAGAELLGQLVALVLPTEVAGHILKEGLLIVGWVAMWRPLEIFLYDWWPIRRFALLYEKLSITPVNLQADQSVPSS